MTLAEIPSASDPNTTYKLVQAKDGSIYCTCPSWRFSGKNGRPRTCKHLTVDARVAVVDSVCNDPASTEADIERALALLSF